MTNLLGSIRLAAYAFPLIAVLVAVPFFDRQVRARCFNWVRTVFGGLFLFYVLCVLALERHGVKPADGEILVTGAAGGVGSVAIAVLAKLGYSVVAVTGRPQDAEYLQYLGATEVLERAQFAAPGKPLGRERWAGAVDVVGSHVLANVCATMKYRGVVAACGLAAGMDLPATVAPFILRGVTLAGVDSVMCPRAERLVAWQRLATDLDLAKLEKMSREVGLAEAIPLAASLLNGEVRGRVIVDVNR